MSEVERKEHERAKKKVWNDNERETRKQLEDSDPIVAEIVESTKDSLWIYFSTEAPFASQSRRRSVSAEKYQNQVRTRYPGMPDSAKPQGKRLRNVSDALVLSDHSCHSSINSCFLS